MTRFALRALASFLCAAAFAAQARAQGTCSTSVGSKCAAITIAQPNASSLTNPRIVQLSVSPTAGTWSVTAARLDAGSTDVVPVTMTVWSNRGWTVSMNGASTWTVSGGATPKSTSQVLWGTSALAANTPLSTTPSVVASGAAGSQMVSTIYMRALVGWSTDRPGTYTMPLTFTIASP